MNPVRRVGCLPLLLLALGFSAQAAKTPTVAVLPFSTRVLDSAAIDGLMSEMNSDLINTGSFRVMERSQMDAILKEQGFQQSGACDGSDCAIEVGKLLAVDDLILCTIGKVGNTYTLSARLVDVRTGEVEKSVTRNSRAEVDAILTEILPEVAKELGAGRMDSALSASVATAKIAAVPAPDSSDDSDSAGDDSDQDADTTSDGWQKLNVSVGVTAQQPHLKVASGDTLVRGSNLVIGREWTHGAWTLSPQVALDGSKTQLPAEDSTYADANFSLGGTWSPLDWLSANVTGFYSFQTGSDHDAGATALLKSTYDANDHLSFALGFATTWSRQQHGSAFLEPEVSATSSWLDADAELDLGGQWESYSRLADSTKVRKLLADTIVQTIHPDSGEVPMLQASASLSFHGKTWSIGPTLKFQAWLKTTQDTTVKGKTARLVQHQYTTSPGISGAIHPRSWLDLDLDVSDGIESGGSDLNGHTLTQRSNPRLAKKFPWLKTANLPAGWVVSLTAQTHW
jgi:TolB-like protein